jgi:hypothetical protein
MANARGRRLIRAATSHGGRYWLPGMKAVVQGDIAMLDGGIPAANGLAKGGQTSQADDSR